MTRTTDEKLDLIEYQQRILKDFQDLSRNYVPGEGSHTPKVFIVGEAPGAQEDMKRRPFVGTSGLLLRRLMASVGLHSTYGAHTIGHPLAGNPNCWLTNAVKFRPPRNRKPYPKEIKAAQPFLFREWKAVGSPKIIVPVGGTALQAITGRSTSILMRAGKPMLKVSKSLGLAVTLWPMIHPSYALRQPGLQPILEQDWNRFGDWLRLNAPD